MDLTARMVREKTGQESAWNPTRDPAAMAGEVEDMLLDGLTIDEAVHVALLLNPALRSSYQEVGIRKSELVAAGLPSNPLFSLSTRFPEGGGTSNVTTSVAQSLLSLALIPARKRGGRERLSIARLQVVRQAIQLVADVEGQAFDLIALQSGVLLAQESLAQTQRSEDLARMRLTAGEGDAVDLALTRSAVLVAEKELMLAGRDLSVARAKLQESLGLVHLDGPLAITDPLPLSDFDPGDGDLVELAMDRRLDVALAGLNLRAAAGNLRIEEIGRLNDISLGLERERGDSPPNLTGPVVTGSLPLWSRNQSRISREEFVVARARADLQSTRNRVRREVQESLAQVQAARELVRLFEEQILPNARASLATAQRAWRAGERDLLVVLEAQRFAIEQRRAAVAAIQTAARMSSQLAVVLGGPALERQAAADSPAEELP